MSLLMDALRRAEAQHDPGRPETPDLSLEELPPAPTPEARQSAPPRPDPPDLSRLVARNAFSVKTPPETGRRHLYFALVAGGVAALGITAYFSYQWLSVNKHSLLTHAPASSASARAVSSAPLAELSPPRSAETAPSQAQAPALPTWIPGASPASAARAESSPQSQPAIRLSRTSPLTDPHANRAWAALQNHALEAARRDYEMAYRTDPKNVDTLLALAAIAQREGRAVDAERYRQEAYEADPKDASAQAALLSQSVDAETAESRLKSLLSAQPEAAPLNFALGNLYARQHRWAEAQQVYFSAVAADADHPDYLFNLAVSLDHLHQPRLAAQHYRLALEAAGRRPAAFDPGQAQKRLHDLDP